MWTGSGLVNEREGSLPEAPGAAIVAGKTWRKTGNEEVRRREEKEGNAEKKKKVMMQRTQRGSCRDKSLMQLRML